MTRSNVYVDDRGRPIGLLEYANESDAERAVRNLDGEELKVRERRSSRGNDLVSADPLLCARCPRCGGETGVQSRPRSNSNVDWIGPDGMTTNGAAKLGRLGLCLCGNSVDTSPRGSAGNTRGRRIHSGQGGRVQGSLTCGAGFLGLGQHAAALAWTRSRHVAFSDWTREFLESDAARASE